MAMPRAMLFILLLSLLCAIANVLTEILILTPLEVLRSLHLPAVVLWGVLFLLLAWLMGD
ncbi:hypothetical protein [uncultured Thermosynechococcus sp.]|uniref:hypothetical protein n=1 Tax=uncultured Thermosynechococcus sp. TaxID=436945 RepID=UPI002612AC2A|nr:hypothetical protein [uncultured Thermosynechococcus sp.]